MSVRPGLKQKEQSGKGKVKYNGMNDFKVKNNRGKK
jgi:hypothetical protein